MALIYSPEGAWDGLSDDERSAIYGRYTAFGAAAREAGVISGGDELAPTRDATTVRVREGQTLVTDGPYAEAKEALGGYYLLDCGSMEEALEWASRIPGAGYGAVEVRPVTVHADGGGES
jgi:hypothetical protein